MADLESEIDRLYGLPLGEFVPQRDALAKQLRGEGERELAESIKALAKPTVAAWVANQLARDRELDIQRLLKAGKALREAQADAAAGNADAFAQARRDEQRALGELAEAAHALARQEGLSPAVVERVTRTLRAAVVTDEGRALLKQGRLTGELEPPGFEALLDLPPATRPAAKGRSRPGRPATRQADHDRTLREARGRVQARRAEKHELTKAAAAAERAAERAEREAGSLRQAATRARAEAEAAARKLGEAERQLAELKDA